MPIGSDETAPRTRDRSPLTPNVRDATLHGPCLRGAAPGTAQVVTLPFGRAGFSDQQTQTQSSRMRWYAAVGVVLGLFQAIALVALPGWWRAPLAGSLAPAHAALVAYAVTLLGLALLHVIVLTRHSAAPTPSDAGTPTDAEEKATLLLSTVF